jgi:cation diffusion facilitator CzcD-associated flavoprotein CzcO
LIMPPVDTVIPAMVRRVLQFTPGMLALQRFIVYWIAEADFVAFSASNRRFRAHRQGVAEKYMRSTAPEKYLDFLLPEWEYGCKRRIYDSGYLEALHRPNITLTDEPAVEILENGVRLRTGEVVEADVIVLANGFQMNDLLQGVDVVGRRGKTLKEHWEEFGGLEAYNSTSLNGFPNFFFTLGEFSCGACYEPLRFSHGRFLLTVIRPQLCHGAHISRHGDRKLHQLRSADYQARA